MNVDYNYKAHGINHNPVLEAFMIDEDLSKYTSQIEIEALFPKNVSKLKTWGAGDTSHCHYISVCKGTPLHVDKGYKRYSHQLILFVKGFVTSGLNMEETILRIGLYHVLDGHSPHKLDNKGVNNCKYVAVAFDSDVHLPSEKVIPMLMEYLEKEPIMKKFNYHAKNL